MKSFFILMICLITTYYKTKAQKLFVTDTTYNFWGSVNGGSLSNDGRFAFYTVNNRPVGKKTFVLMATDKSWQIELLDIQTVDFTNDSHYLYCLEKDTLYKIDLISHTKELIGNCARYNLYEKGKLGFLTYLLKNRQGKLIVQNLKKNRRWVFQNVHDYVLDPNNGAIFLITKVSDTTEQLNSINLTTGKSRPIFRGYPTSNFIFDASGNNMAFTVDKKGLNSIYNYKSGMDSARFLADDFSLGIDKELKIATDEIWSFNKDGDILFFTQIEREISQANNEEEPEVWNYQDEILYSHYKKVGDKASLGLGRNLTSLQISDKEITRILRGKDRLSNGIANGKVFLIQKSEISHTELPFPDREKISYRLYITHMGTSMPIKTTCNSRLENIVISPDDKFLVFYDPEISNFISFNISAKTSENITKAITTLGKLKSNIRGTITPTGIVGWLLASENAIIQGTYDVWQVDLMNRTLPKRLTHQDNNDGQSIFSFCSESQMHRDINEAEDLYIKGFNVATKMMSIYVLNLSKGRFDKLYMSDCYSSDLYSSIAPSRFIQAGNKKSFLFKFEKVNETPNYVFTKDFKCFTALSHVHPETSYNWLTSELLTYKDTLGNVCHGILYKPENFDPKNKYPILFSIYQEQANRMGQFIGPEPEWRGINIPILVSNGYLVFIPDVYSTKGQFGEMALTSVMAGFNALAKYSWVDSTKICLAGHSLGGWEVNHIITKTNKFAAAIVAAGPSSAISNFNDLWVEGRDLQGYVGHQMGGRLEDITDTYIKTSPILYSKDIRTPLLLMHNREDANVPFYHSTQMFVQLRSIQKKVWLITYPGEIHVITKLKFQLDYQSKVIGYLDYFLKGKPMPEWMDEHIILK
jgi:dienelactone hydrolase